MNHTDLHCHILPGLGGGPETLEQSLKLASQLHKLGFRRIVATPHIMKGFYNTSPEQVRAAVNLLQRTLLDAGISLFIDTAAQYYIDEGLLSLLENRGEVLPFGTFVDAPRSLLLVETSLVSFPDIWYDITDLLHARGLVPVLAHPERYIYLQRNRDWVRLLRNRGTLFKIDVASLSGRYGQESRQMAEWLIDQGHVSFIGTDMSNEQHLRIFRESLQLPYGHRLRKG